MQLPMLSKLKPNNEPKWENLNLEFCCVDDGIFVLNT